MRTTLRITSTVIALAILASALPAFAQDPPSILASTDPVELGRSETTGNSGHMNCGRARDTPLNVRLLGHYKVAFYLVAVSKGDVGAKMV